MPSNKKYWSRNLYCLTATLLLFPYLRGQQLWPVFIKADDFTNYLIVGAKDSCNCKVKLSLAGSKIKIVCPEKKLKLSIDSVYGFVGNDGFFKRCASHCIYTILNPGENLLIYKTETYSQDPRNFISTTAFYFSKTPDSDIKPLTLKNVISEFKDNPRFLTFVELHFNSNSSLSEYSEEYNQFKLNRLLQLSLK